MKNKKYLNVFNEIVKLQSKGKLADGIRDIKLEDMDEDMLKGYICSAMNQEPDTGASLKDIAKQALNESEANRPIISVVGNCSECIKKDEKELKCVNSCPFDAIFKDSQAGRIRVDADKCEGCGECVKACSLERIVDKIQYMPIANLLKDKKVPVYATIAPAYIGQFGDEVTPGKMRTALKMIGFKDLIEVALFADIISIREAIEFKNLVKNVGDFMITSCCCPIWMSLLKRHYKELVEHVTPSVSPMIASGRVIKKICSDAKVVFIGPCIAKKSEAKEPDIKDAIDYVLTFDELNEIFKALNIDPSKLEGDVSEYSSKGGRIYARVGGVSECIIDTLNKLSPNHPIEVKDAHANGVKECKQLLDKALKGELDVNFLEGMGCIGGCVGGPRVMVDKELGKECVNRYGNEAQYHTPLDGPCAMEVLRSIGIESIKKLEEGNEKSRMFLRNL